MFDFFQGCLAGRAVRNISENAIENNRKARAVAIRLGIAFLVLGVFAASIDGMAARPMPLIVLATAQSPSH